MAVWKNARSWRYTMRFRVNNEAFEPGFNEELWAHFVQLHWVCSECEVHRMLRNFRGELVIYASGSFVLAVAWVLTITHFCEVACKSLSLGQGTMMGQSLWAWMLRSSAESGYCCPLMISGKSGTLKRMEPYEPMPTKNVPWRAKLRKVTWDS